MRRVVPLSRFSRSQHVTKTVRVPLRFCIVVPTDNWDNDRECAVKRKVGVVGRRPNPQRKIDLLQQIVDYILVNGLSDMSLRPLANELGTSTYTLTYQFGSKEAMVVDAVAHIDKTQHERLSELDRATDTPNDVLRNLWELSTSDEGRRWSQVMLEIATLTSRQPILFETFTATALHGRIEHLAKAYAGGLAPTADQINTATLQIATVSGLITDALTSGQSQRAETAFTMLLNEPEIVESIAL